MAPPEVDLDRLLKLRLAVAGVFLAAALAGCGGTVVGGGEVTGGDASAAVPEAGTDAHLPEADSPEADAPEADAPEADAPEADAPEADAPEADAPEADALDAGIEADSDAAEQSDSTEEDAGCCADAPEEPGHDAEQEPHACPQGLVDCAGTCIDPQSDAYHCGAADGCTGPNAGIACEAGQSCIVGTCTCKPGLAQCPAGCVDVGIDDANCGSCGSGCGVGTHCTGGACLACSDVPLLPGLPAIGADEIIAPALGDVDHDGRIDLAYVREHTLRVALGRGNGTFGEAAEYPLSDAQGVKLADVDADGWLDFVVAAGATWAVVGSVLVVPNVAGIPGAPVSYPTAKDASAELAVGDLNADGMPEIVVGGAEPTGLRVLMNQGDGTFAAPLTYPTAAIPRIIAAGDLNGDGLADLAEADGKNVGIGVLLNLGDGTFGPASQNDLFPKVLIRRVLIRDLDGHAPSELVASASSVAVCRLAGGALSCPETYSVGTSYALHADDVDNDGDVDLIAGGNGSLTVLPNSGDGTFGPPSAYTTYFDIPLSLNAADLTGDGYPEIVVGEHFGGKLLLNRGDGTFVEQREGVSAGVDTDSLALVDLDLDGSTDLVIGSYGTEGLRVALNDGNGNFGSPLAYATENNSRPGIAVGDLNGDGLPDVVATRNGAIRAFVNEGGGIFSPGVDWPISQYPLTVAVGDLNGDGVADIVSGDLVYTVAGATNILFGLGGATYSAPVSYPGPGYAVGPVIADMNLDGASDLVIGTQVDGDVTVRLNAGDGTFAAQTTYHAACFGWTIVVADLNGDGAPDLALPGCYDGGVAVLWNDGQGAFPSTEIIPGGADEKFIQAAAGDLNGDGLTDIVLGYPYGNSIGALLNLGGGSFTKTVFYPIGRRPWGPSVADIDGDGRQDILAPMSESQGVRILLNKGFACSAP